MNTQFQRGTVGGNGGNRRGITGATYSRENLRQQMAEAQQRSEAPQQRPTQQQEREAAQQRANQGQRRSQEPRSNKYGAKCARCGGWVPEGTGLLLGSRQQGWRVEHVQPCPIDEVVAEAKTQDEAEQANPGRNVVAGQVIYDGLYTVETPDGHRTFRLKTQGEDKDFMPGAQIIAFLSGPDNEDDYTRFGHIRNGRLTTWKRFRDNVALVRDAETLMADPSGALSSANCFRCGRTLTVPASVHAGLGPECAKRAR